jgi:hypothetical protein
MHCLQNMRSILEIDRKTHDAAIAKYITKSLQAQLSKMSKIEHFTKWSSFRFEV